MPVAYVHYTVTEDRSDARRLSPSMAIVSIRKYLAEQLDNHPTIDFQVLGPSPFHADIFLDAALAEEVAGNSIDVTHPGDGYRTIIALTESSNPEEQADEFIAHHHKILQTYYSIIRTNNHSHTLKAAVTQGATDLLAPEPTRSPWRRFQHWRVYGHRIDEVFQDLLEEKLNRVAMERFLSSIQEDEEISPDNVLYRFIERETKPSANIVDEDIRELCDA